MAGFSSVPDHAGVAVIDGHAPEPVRASVMDALQQLGYSFTNDAARADIHCILLWGNSAWGAPAASFSPDVSVPSSHRGAAGSRLILITDFSPYTLEQQSPAEVELWGAQLARWRRLTLEAARDKVSANMVRVGYCPELGHRLDRDAQWALRQHQLIRRPATVDDLRHALAMLAGPGTNYLSGEVIPLDGGLDAVFIPPLADVPDSDAWITDEPPRPAPLGPVLVTGASSGVGAATAHSLARRGVETVLVGRDATALERVSAGSAELGGKSHVIVADLAQPLRASEVVEEAWLRTGGIGQLCYAAGALLMDRPRDPAYSADNRNTMFDVNLRAFADMCDQLVQRWIEAGIRGSIAAVGSVTGAFAPLSHCHSYAATKGGVVAYSRELATTTARYGIRANCVRAGIIDTPMGGTAGPDYRAGWLNRIPMRTVGPPDELSELLCDLMAPESGYITGTGWLWDGGLHMGAVFPADT